MDNTKHRTIAKEVLQREQQGESLEQLLAEYPDDVQPFIQREIEVLRKERASVPSPSLLHRFLRPFSGGHFLSRAMISGVITVCIGLVVYTLFSGMIPFFAYQKPSVAFAASYPEQQFPIDGRLSFQITSSGKVNRVALERAFSLKPAVEGEFVWEDDDREFSFQPTAPLKPDTEYMIEFSGEELAGETAWVIHTTPSFAIVETSPRDRAVAVPTSVAIRVHFNYSSVNFPKYPEHFSIVPEVEGDFRYEGMQAFFVPSEPLEKETEYQVTIVQGLKNSAGETILADYSFSFLTAGDRHVEHLTLNGIYQKLVTESYYNSDHRFSLYYNEDVEGEVEFSLYQSDVATVLADNLLGDDTGEYLSPKSIVDVSGLSQLTSWVVELPPLEEGEYMGEVFSSIPVQDPGIYYLTAKHGDESLVRTHVVVSKYSLVEAKEDDSSFLWVADIQNSLPIAGVPVKRYSLGSEAEEQGTVSTDADGVVRGDSSADVFVAQQDGNTMFIFSSPYDYGWGMGGERPYFVHLSTERPLYQPGQTVFWKGIIRADRGEMYAALPEGTKVVVELTSEHAWDEVIWEEEMLLSAEGTCDGSISLPASWKPGRYYLHVTVGGEEELSYASSFEVGTYQKPTYELAVSTNKYEYTSKEKIAFNVEGTYLAGQQPIADKEFSYKVYASPFRFPRSALVAGDYSFLEYYGKPYWGGEFASGTESFDEEGKALVYIESDLGDRKDSQVFLIECSFADESGVQVVASKSVIVYRGQFTLETKDGQALRATLGEEFPVSLVAETHRGEVFPKANVTVSFERQWWEKVQTGEEYDKHTDKTYPIYSYERKTEQVDYMARQMDDQGTVTISMTPEKSGTYVMTAKGEDLIGNMVTFTETFWAPDSTGYSGFSSRYLEIIPDKAEYAPGETATLTIVSPRDDGNMLVLYGHDRVLDYSLPSPVDGVVTVDIPITESMVPSTTVHAAVLYEDAVVDGSVLIPISAEGKLLSVDITADKETYSPGEEATFSLTATDADGNPVASELSFALVDKGIYLLQGDMTTDLFSAFYTPSYGSIFFSDSLFAPLPEIGGGRGGGGEGGGGGVRSVFKDTAHWEAVVRTNAQGHGEVSVVLPDNLTTWVATVRGISLDETLPLAGTAYFEVPTGKEVFVEPAIPLFAHQDDTLVLSAQVHNYSGQTATFAVSLEADALEYAEGTPKEQEVTIEHGKTANVSWRVVASEADEAAITLKTESVDGDFSDEVEQKLRLYPVGYEYVQSRAGEVEYPSTTVDFSLDQGKAVELRLYPSLAASLYETIQHLNTYSYRNTEELVANLLPMVIVLQHYEQLGFEDHIWREYLEEAVVDALGELDKLQHPDGGWGWFSYDASDPELTALVVATLLRAQAEGQDVASEMVDAGVAYLEPLVEKATLSNETKSYLAYVLALAGRSKPKLLDSLKATGNLAVYGQAFLGLSYLELGDEESARAVLQDIEGQAVFSDNAVFWEEEVKEYVQLFSGTYFSTAAVFELLVKVDSEHELVEKCLRWLQSAKSGYLWHETVATSQTMIALAEYLVATQEQLAEVSYTVRVNGRQVDRGTFESHEHEPVFVPLAAEDLASDTTVTITKSGRGALFYQLDQKQYIYDTTKRRENQLAVRRQYYNQSGVPVQLAKVGDVLQVILTVENSYDYAYVRLTDSLPAGCEPIITDRDNVRWEDQRRAVQQEGFLFPTAQYTLSNRMVFFQRSLDAGTHRYTYNIRAVTPGVFTVNPAKAELTYIPEIVGESDLQTLEVTL